MSKIIFLCSGNNADIDGGIEVEYAGRIRLYDAFITACRNNSNGDFHTNLSSSLNFPCGGKGTCRKCKVEIINGSENISPPDEGELKHLSPKEINGGIRLICMCEAWGDVVISTCGDGISDDGNINKNRKMIIQTGGIQSQATRTPDFSGTSGSFGAAVDIGTTTVAVYLCDIDSGKIIDIAAAENPQRIYGADVISRINYIIESENKSADKEAGKSGLNELKSSILSLVFKLIEKLCDKNSIKQKNIKRMVFTGNTIMQHIAAGISPKSIAFAPFTAPTLFDCEINLAELTDGTNLKSGVDPDTGVYFPAAIASYVGGDITTGIIASDTDLTASRNTRLFLDIGTNGEMGLGNKEKLIFCATAAGPAFEGATIKQGLPGIDGAINRIYIDGENRLAYTVIGGSEPRGICGSGIIDAASVLLETGIIDETGRIIGIDEIGEIDGVNAEKHKDIYASLDEVDGENIFYIDKKYNIYITQKDIREIQLAKAAVCAGIMTLLHYGKKTVDDIDEVILAGGFGAKIDIKSACKIGLIPAELEMKVNAAGNTAGMGAVAALTDLAARKRISAVKAMAEYIELSGDAFFMDEYIDKMMF